MYSQPTGKHGKKPGVVRPFERLTRHAVQEELRARELYDFGTTKKEATEMLTAALKGVQRVPTLLLTNPTQSLHEVNLQFYTILDCEPLHDMKGHLQNLIDELPHILSKPLAEDCKVLINADLKKEKKTGADYRLVAIHLLCLLRKKNGPAKIVQLVASIVSICELLYAKVMQQTPKAILRLYTLTWLHFELCTDLFLITKVVTHRKLFGQYLHALIVHAPPQYEIVCMKSCNSEKEERLFGQAGQMAICNK